MREALSEVLVETALRDPKLVLLTGDHGYALFDEFRAKCPDQYLNVGVAEQNMVGAAAGLAAAGYRPVVYALSAFVPIRVLEQIKLDLCYTGVPAILLGDGAGFVYSALGSSHQSTEDIAALRSVPGISILSPADAHELRACFRHAAQFTEPTYLRIGKADLGAVHVQALEFDQLAGPVRVGGGVDTPVVVLATGSMVRPAQDIVAELDPDRVAVFSVPAIKPLREDLVLAAIGDAAVAVTIEEHHVSGGLGSAVAEVVCDSRPTRVVRLGVRDRFSACAGSYQYLLREHGLSPADLRESILAACAHAETDVHSVRA